MDLVRIPVMILNLFDEVIAQQDTLLAGVHLEKGLQVVNAQLSDGLVLDPLTFRLGCIRLRSLVPIDKG